MALGWARQNSCIVMVCGGGQADQLRRQLSDQGTGCLMTYRRVEDLVLNCPTGRVALVILAGEDDPAGTHRTLRWLGHRWPGCPITVVSAAGGVEHEMAARQGGAFYLTSGEAGQQLPDMVSHVLRVQAGDKAGFSAQLSGVAELLKQLGQGKAIRTYRGSGEKSKEETNTGIGTEPGEFDGL